MKKYFGYFFLYLIQFTWGIVNNILGFILFLVYGSGKKAEKEFYHGAILSNRHEGGWGLSMGIFIFVDASRDPEWVRGARFHEFGHVLQSTLLGPFYLIFVALPSVIWASYWRKQKKTGPDGELIIEIPYDRLYCESWANNWGSAFTKEEPSHHYGQTQKSIDDFKAAKAARLAKAEEEKSAEKEVAAEKAVEKAAIKEDEEASEKEIASENLGASCSRGSMDGEGGNQ